MTEELTIGRALSNEAIAVQAFNRQALINYVNRVIGNRKISPEGTYLHISFYDEETGHTCTKDYKTEADIPYCSVPCDCGCPNHWLIKYDEEV